MRVIAIDAVPNQSFSVRAGDALYDFVIKETRGVMSADVSRNSVRLVSGARVCAGSGLLPYPYMADGNFIITTDSGDLVDWQKFGTSQTLLYLTQAEIDALPYPPEA